MKAKTFRGKLWRYFVLLTVIILGLVWLLQTVFLQSSYQRMVADNVKSIADRIAARRADADFERWLDEATADNSLLIFITDPQGQVLYATDEHNGVYTVQTTAAPEDSSNPYRQGEQNWEKGQSHYLSLPSGYSDFLSELEESENGVIARVSEDGTTYIYGCRIGGEIIYISTALSAVGATVRIIRIQLVWVTGISLMLAFGLAWLLAKRLSRPVSVIAAQARNLAEGQYDPAGTKGFSAELDTLSESLEQAAADITEARAYQKDFLANISHDLRTPLTMIKGYAEMVRDISWRDETKRESDLGVIIREADRLTALVNDIVDFEGMESGKMQPKTEPFCFSAMAKEVVEQFASLCEKEGYAIETEIAPDLYANGERAMLSRVLYNLIDNAVTHTGDSRKVALRVSLRSGVIRAEVRDEGPGIPADILPQVWERYFRAAQRKRNKKGSGLGLASSREIIEAHGGKYGAESVEGKGSTFWFEIGSTKIPQ